MIFLHFFEFEFCLFLIFLEKLCKFLFFYYLTPLLTICLFKNVYFGI